MYFQQSMTPYAVCKAGKSIILPTSAPNGNPLNSSGSCQRGSASLSEEFCTYALEHRYQLRSTLTGPNNTLSPSG